MIVVDTNILVYLYTGDERSPAADRLLEHDPEWVAPVLWRSEFRNALSGILRSGRLTMQEILALQAEAEDFMADGEYQVDSNRVLSLAGRSGCSAYDCEFVSLAEELGTHLVTADQRVLKAFPEVAVPLILE